MNNRQQLHHNAGCYEKRSERVIYLFVMNAYFESGCWTNIIILDQGIAGGHG